MPVRFLPTALLAVAFVSVPAKAQQNSREELRLYRQQAGPIGHDARDWRDFRNYDFDRLESGQRAYYANRYYRDWRYYESRALGAEDRVYRGRDRRYYCRRPDGTTGRISGLIGRMRDDDLVRGGSSLLGDLAAGNGGGRLTNAVDKGRVTCR